MSFEDGKLPSVLDDAVKMGYNPESSLYDALFATKENKAYKWPDKVAKGHDNHIAKNLGWFVEKAMFEEYRQFGTGHGHDLAPFDVYYDDKVRGLKWSALVGEGATFVSELDESDGTIALYQPKVSVLNNISLDHKSIDELRALFGDFVAKADIAVLNLDDDQTRRLAYRAKRAVTYSIDVSDADFGAVAIRPERFGVPFTAIDNRGDEQVRITLQAPGRHNVSNALAAIAATTAIGVPFVAAAQALSEFAGIKRRFEFVGETNGITVIDDFGHNPDKIAATLRTLHEFPGRLLIMFQPHGFGPLKKMKAEFIDCFAQKMAAEDILLMPEPVYFGGTVDRSVGSRDIAIGVSLRERHAEAHSTREACGRRLLDLAAPGDRIVVMGARDDTLSTFAADLFATLSSRR